MSFGWIGDKVRLVPLEREKHLENCVRWLNDPHVTEWTLMGDFPMTRGAEEDYFARVSLEPRTDVGFAIETLEEEHIGVCAISRIDYRHGFGTEGIIIGRHQLWRRGYGSDALALLTRYGFDVLGLRILLAIAFPENVASLKALAKAGFHEVGRIPQRWWKRGTYRDEIQLAVTSEQWQATTKVE